MSGIQSVLNAKRYPSDEDERDKPLEFRRKARIWSLYLEDAEREARERVDIWRTGLDSLLIFVRILGHILTVETV